MTSEDDEISGEPASEALIQASALFDQRREAFDRGEYAEALPLLRRSGELYPYFKAYELAGDCLTRLGDPATAVLYLAAAAGLGNRQSRARFLLARALLAMDCHDKAILKLEEAVELNPDYKTARQLLAELRERYPDPNAEPDAEQP
jgi:tetratricopeptide (TPR) repeat protein